MKDWAESFYYSKAWQRTRQAVLINSHYQCSRCGGLATMVHHKIYLTPGNIMDPEITLGLDNLEPLCDTCHQHEHHVGAATMTGLKFSASGDLIEK